MARKKRRFLTSLLFGVSIVVTTVLILAVGAALWGDKIGLPAGKELWKSFQSEVDTAADYARKALSSDDASSSPTDSASPAPRDGTPMDSYSEADKRRLERVLEE